ncbi:hypothetical protein D3C87_1627750 [compost metagenome]
MEGIVLTSGELDEGIVRALAGKVAAHIGVFDATCSGDFDPVQFRHGERDDFPCRFRCDGFGKCRGSTERGHEDDSDDLLH